MIHEIRIKNFFSIGDEVKLNFEAKPGGITYPELYLDAPFGKKMTKVAFLGGPNASGKSNILRAFSFIKELVTDRVSEKSLPYLPFFTKKKMVEGSEIEIRFCPEEDAEYLYYVSFLYDRIKEEKLSVTKLVTKRASTHDVFVRKWDGEKYFVKLDDSLANIKRIKDISGLVSEKENQKNSIVSLFSYLDEKDGELRKMAEYWEHIATNVPTMGNAESNRPLTVQASEILRDAKEHPDEYGDLISFLKRVDSSITEVYEHSGGENNSRKLYGLAHHYADATLNLLTITESNGTNRAICLIATILKALSNKNGGVAIIDEADVFLHPDIYDQIIEMFMSHSINKHNTQLIISSHNYTTLNSLDKQQIFLSEKNARGYTEVWRLDEIEGVDSRDNFYTKYLAGAYGAVPRGDD